MGLRAENADPMRIVFFFLAVLILTLVGWIAWFAFGNTAPEWLRMTLVIWCWFLGPLLVVLLGRDAKDELDYEDPKGPIWTLVRVSISTPLGCFGVISVLAGVGMAIALVHQIFIARDPEALDSLAGLGVISTFILFGGTLLIHAFKRGGPSRREEEILEAERLMVLENPDWEFYEGLLERPVPELLKKHHGQRDVFFVPFGENEGANAIWSGIHPDELWDFGEESEMILLPFAELLDSDGLFVLKPGAESDDRVYFLDQHAEPGENLSLLFGSVEEFLESIEPEN